MPAPKLNHREVLGLMDMPSYFMKSLFAAVPVLLLLGMVQTPLHAAVYQCKTADGKLVFSDQRCPVGQDGVDMKIKGTSPAASSLPTDSKSSPSVQDVQNKAQRERVHAALTPECRALGDRASRSLQSNSNASLDDVKRATSAFEDRCGTQVLEATRKEGARGQAPLDLAACRGLRQALDADRGRLGKMTNQEVAAFATRQNEVSIACR